MRRSATPAYRSAEPVHYGSEIAAVTALTMMKSKTPTWTAIASPVKTSQPTLQPPSKYFQTAFPQTTTATTGMRQNNATTRPAGGAGTWNRLQATSNSKYAVGLKNAASQIAALDQAS